MRRLRCDEGGFTITEVLLATVMMTVVLLATLGLFDSFNRTTRTNEAQNDSQEQARRSMGQLARELRNHAVANTAAPEGIALATPYDLVFETVGRDRPAATSNSANIERIRYCLDVTNPADSDLYAQHQRWTTASPPAMPPTDKCPAFGWDKTRKVAESITNRIGGANRPVFTYDAAVAAQVRRVAMTLYIDTEPATAPKETRLDSGIFLRNANHAPTAAFTTWVNGSGRVVLNGTASTDPERERLLYSWKAEGTELDSATGTVEWTPPGSGTYTIELRVSDPGGLFGVKQQTVTVP